MKRIISLAIIFALSIPIGVEAFACENEVPYELKEESFKNPWGDPFPVNATAYCSCCECCGHSHGITRSGKKAKQGITVASNQYYGKTIIMYDEDMNFMGFYECMDTGNSEMNGIDIFMDSHEEAIDFGERQMFIQVVDAVG